MFNYHHLLVSSNAIRFFAAFSSETTSLQHYTVHPTLFCFVFLEYCQQFFINRNTNTYNAGKRAEKSFWNFFFSFTYSEIC